MGTQQLKGYAIQGEPTLNVGSLKNWKLYTAVKETTKARVSVFLIEKKHLKKSNNKNVTFRPRSHVLT